MSACIVLKSSVECVGEVAFKKNRCGMSGGDSFLKNRGADGQIVRPRCFAFIKIWEAAAKRIRGERKGHNFG
ncbi:MAG: hypothetical protein DBX39_03380 [Bacillota bacterium]|nr:MAG: hypothetical protein DBX39_03380 [Bacillota bacterium]